VVVGFNLGQEVNDFLGVHPLSGGGVGGPESGLGTFQHSGVVTVGTDGVIGVLLVCVTNHGEKAVRHGLAIDHPRGIELLVSAVLGVDLSKHEQLDIGGVAGNCTVGAICLSEIIDL
jgi:hypothetical protein